MSVRLLSSRLAALTLPSQQIAGFHTSTTNHFWTTTVLNAEPLKKRKKIDPSLIKARDERKKKKLEKSIRQLQKNALKLKPIDEMVITKKFTQEIPQRVRKLPALSEEEEERRILLVKSWTRYKRYQYLAERDKLDSMMMCQESALRELRLENEELYQKAVAVDANQLPFTIKGPVFTPPLKDYDVPDGDYVDTTRKW